MFSGAKHKLQRWRQRKASAKIMTNIPKETFQKKIQEVTEHLGNLNIECGSIVHQLNKQVSALDEIQENTTVVEEKIHLLQEHSKAIDKGLEEAKACTSFYECIEALNTAIKRETSEIEDFHRQASSLFNENRKLRTELQIFLDHHERSELRTVELQSQVEHLKFMNSLPSDFLPFFETEGHKAVQEDEEKFIIKPQVAVPFLEEDSLENAGSYILSVLDTLDFKNNSRMKILFDLIKSYIKDQAYDIAIPLLKTTVEDLTSSLDNPRERLVFTMMEVLVIVYNMTQRLKDATEVQKEILEIRKTSMVQDQIGLAQTLSSLAILHGKLGKVKSARNFCRQALDLKNKVFGERDLETAKELHNMGVLYTLDGKYTKAINCFLTAIKIMRTASKRNVFCLASAAANLAFVHIQNDELLEAKCLYNSALKFLDKELGKILEGKNLSKEEVIAEGKMELLDYENKDEIRRIVNLLAEVTEKAKSVSHMQPNADEKYRMVSIISDEE